MLISIVPLNAQDQDFHQILSFGRGRPRQSSWNPKGDRIYVSSITGLWIYDSKTLELVRHLDVDMYYFSFSPDGRWLNIGTTSSTSKILDTTTYQEVDTPSGLRSVRFSPDGRWLVGIVNNHLYRFDTTTFVPESLKTNGISDDTSLKWSPDSDKLLLLQGDSSVQIIYADDGRLLVDIPAYTNDSEEQNPPQANWTPDSTRIIRLYPSNYTVNLKIHDAITGKLIKEQKESNTFGVSFSPDGKLLALNDGIYDALSLTNVIPIPSGDFNYTGTWSPDSKYVAFPNNVGTGLQIFDIETQTVKYSISAPQSRFQLSWQWSPDNQKLLNILENGEILIWDAANGEQIGALQEHINLSSNAAFSDDGLVLAVDDRVGNVRLWNTQTGQQIATLKGHLDFVDTLLWQPNGHLLVTRSYYKDWQTPAADLNTLYVWDGKTGELFDTIQLSQNVAIVPVVWSPDGKKLLFGNDVDTDVQVWDVNTRQYKVEFVWDGGFVYASYPSISWSPDNRVLVLIYRNATHGGIGLRLYDSVNKDVLVPRIYSSSNHQFEWSTSDSQLRVAYAYCKGYYPITGCRMYVKIAYDENNPSVPTEPEIGLQDSGITFGNFNDLPTNLSWSNDGSLLAATVDNRVMVWAIDLKRGLSPVVWREKFDQPRLVDERKISWSPSANKLIICIDANESQVIDISTGDLLLTIPGTECPFWGENDSTVYVKTYANNYMSSSTSRWNLATGEMRQFPSTQLVWSADGNQYADLSGGAITLWSQ